MLWQPPYLIPEMRESLIEEDRGDDRQTCQKVTAVYTEWASLLRGMYVCLLLENGCQKSAAGEKGGGRHQFDD